MTVIDSWIEVDGKRIDPESPEALRFASDALMDSHAILNDAPIAHFLPDEARDTRSKLMSALMDLSSYCRQLAEGLDRYDGNRELAESEAHHRLVDAERILRKRRVA